MPKHVLIVGGGVGGTIVANLLARSLHGQEAEITVIDSTGNHVYMPGWLYLPFNRLEANSDHLVRPERHLLKSPGKPGHGCGGAHRYRESRTARPA